MKQPSNRALQVTWTDIHIVEWCAYRGLSQAKLAKRSGLSVSLISQLFAREANGSPDSLERIAAALHIPLGFLFDVVPQPGGRWVRYWVPERHLATVHTMIRALGAEAGKIEGEP